MKKVLIIGPVLAEWVEIQGILNTLHFLDKEYKIEIIDPLSNITAEMNENVFFSQWRVKLKPLIAEYHAFLGFSLGGTILQTVFDYFENTKKPVVLFSVPSFADALLRDRLGTIIRLIKEKSVEAAIAAKNQLVFYPAVPPEYKKIVSNPINAAFRLSFGLRCVLAMDSRSLMTKNVNYLHFIGEKSQLVNRHNVMTSSPTQLIEVPMAGMRVLTDNPEYCQMPLIQFLEEKK